MSIWIYSFFSVLFIIQNVEVNGKKRQRKWRRRWPRQIDYCQSAKHFNIDNFFFLCRLSIECDGGSSEKNRLIACSFGQSNETLNNRYQKWFCFVRSVFLFQFLLLSFILSMWCSLAMYVCLIYLFFFVVVHFKLTFSSIVFIQWVITCIRTLFSL